MDALDKININEIEITEDFPDQLKLKDRQDTKRYWETNDGKIKFERLVCPQCYSRAFEILYTGSYETSGKCVECGSIYIVHTG